MIHYWPYPQTALTDVVTSDRESQMCLTGKKIICSGKSLKFYCEQRRKHFQSGKAGLKLFDTYEWLFSSNVTRYIHCITSLIFRPLDFSILIIQYNTVKSCILALINSNVTWHIELEGPILLCNKISITWSQTDVLWWKMRRWGTQAMGPFKCLQVSDTKQTLQCTMHFVEHIHYQQQGKIKKEKNQKTDIMQKPVKIYLATYNH